MLRIVPDTVPRVGCSYEHLPDGIELHLLSINALFSLSTVQAEASGETFKSEWPKLDATVHPNPSLLSLLYYSRA